MLLAPEAFGLARSRSPIRLRETTIQYSDEVWPVASKPRRGNG